VISNQHEQLCPWHLRAFKQQPFDGVPSQFKSDLELLMLKSISLLLVASILTSWSAPKKSANGK
jgi:hypothetical protein